MTESLRMTEQMTNYNSFGPRKIVCILRCMRRLSCAQNRLIRCWKETDIAPRKSYQALDLYRINVRAGKSA